jgi:PleD family two-component response regulator
MAMAYVFEFGADDLEPAPPVAVAPEREGEGDLNILFIGADAEVAEIYRRKLDLDGYRTSVLTSEDEARQMAASLQPDLIYLDLTSTAGWGLSVLGGIRSDMATRSTPVLMLVKFPWRDRPALGPNDFVVPVHLAFDRLRGRLLRRQVDA